MSIRAGVQDAPAEAPPRPAGPSAYTEHRLSVERYLKMVDAGVFGDGEPIFLWRGRLVEKMTKGVPHVFVALALTKALDRVVPEAWHVRHEAPVTIPDDGLPEPDLSIVRGVPRDYLSGHPTPRDVALIIEVADSSLAIDLGEVAEDLAVAAIPVYWVVDIVGRRVEVFGDPAGSNYLTRRSYRPGERVPVVLDGREVGSVAVDEFLP